MEAIFQIVGAPSSLVIIFATIIGISAWLDNISSQSARKDLSRYILTTDFPAASIKLPSSIEELFERLFGTEHFSQKCALRSAAISLGAIIFLLALGFLTHYQYFKTMPSFIIDRPGFRIKYFGFIFWSLFVDYINLYKTRLIIRLATRKKTTFIILLLVLLGDVFLSYILFSGSYFFFECINMAYQLLSLGAISISRFIPTAIWIFKVNVIEQLIEQPRTLVFLLRGPFSNEIAVLFYAGLLPSIWLWLLTASLFVMSAVVKGKAIIQAAIYFLDIEEHPMRSLGIVAASLVSAVWGLILIVRLVF